MKTNLNFDFNFSIHLGATTVTVDVKSDSSLIGLRAPSGSGKSSFIRTILGLNKNYSGKEFSPLTKVGYVPQDSLLIPTMNVKSNLLLSPFAQESELTKICDELSIGHLLDRYPRMLSGGEKQRVSIGRALLSQPQVLVMDEPFAALDYEIRNHIANFIKIWIQLKKIDLILVTHDVSSSDFLCEEFWSIKNNHLTLVSKR